jgi:BirA family biotin operon repressor/biotin-[acetyl-CoA-carboxylase] ligase
VDVKTLSNRLEGLPLGRVGYFEVLESTNSFALSWLEEGTPHLSLVVADEQTAGRGRGDSTWFTPRGAALAFSLVIRDAPQVSNATTRLPGLGALAVCDVLQSKYDLPAKIKWPNDVLVQEKKLAGVLVDAQWRGDEILSAVLGIGINVARKSVPAEENLDFPATYVEAAYGKPVDRWSLLKQVLSVLLAGLQKLESDDFIQDWEANLEYKGQVVQIIKPGGERIAGHLVGIDRNGYLILELPNQEEVIIRSGDVRLRQVDRS